MNLMVKKREKPKVPEFLTCNDCGSHAPKELFTYLDTKDIEGINMGISAICPNCGSLTYGFSGDPEEVQKILAMLDEDLEGSGILGFNKA